MMSKKSILYVTNIPSPYRVNFFNEISNYCSLTVICERFKADDRDIKWNNKSVDRYKILYLKGIKYRSDYIISFEIKKYLKNNTYDTIIFCNYSSPSGIIGINYCIVHKIEYFIEADGAFYTNNKIKNLLKGKLLRNASLLFSTCKNLDEYYVKLGVEKSKIMRYKFTSLTEQEIFDNSSLEVNKEYNKAKNVFLGGKVLLYIGQFIYRKGLDLLLESLSYMDGNVYLLAIGGSPTEDMLRIVRKHNLNNVFFYDFMSKDELEMYFRVADYFVLPTREDIWGLVVNEALSYGLPVLTTDRCNAGLELIKEGYNGYIVKHDSVSALTEGLKKMLSNKEPLRENCLKSIKDYTIENMVKNHIEIFNNYGKKESSDH